MKLAKSWEAPSDTRRAMMKGKKSKFMIFVGEEREDVKDLEYGLQINEIHGLTLRA